MMKPLYLTTTFVATLTVSGAAGAYGLLMHPATAEIGCLSVKDDDVVLALADACKNAEANTRWELEKLDGDAVLIHHAPEGQPADCLTFVGEKVVLQSCSKTNDKQQWKMSDNGQKTTLSNGESCLSAFVHPKGTTVDFQKCQGADDDTDWVWQVGK